MSIKVFQLYKPEANSINEIQDRFNISKDKKVIALADGTTQGHQSELWAQHLVDNFVKNPVFTPKGFTKFIFKISKNYNKQSQPDNKQDTKQSVEWLIKQKKKEGSSAAFLAITIDKNNSYKTICYGDSILYHIRDDKVKVTFPPKQKNTFINSDHRLFDVKNIFTKTGKLMDGDRILLVSDSLGDYSQKNVKVNIKMLCSLSSFEEFKSFVESSFESNKMEMDDISLIDIHLDSVNNIYQYLPSENFKYKSSLLPDPKSIISPSRVRITKGEKEMKQLIEMLQSKKNDLKKEIDEYKNITAKLIRMNFIQWMIIAVIIVYFGSSIFIKAFYNVKEKVITTIDEISDPGSESEDTQESNEKDPQIPKDSFKKDVLKPNKD